MTLSEIYQQGAQILESKKLGFNLKGVETEFVAKHNEEIHYSTYPPNST